MGAYIYNEYNQENSSEEESQSSSDVTETETQEEESHRRDDRKKRREIVPYKGERQIVTQMNKQLKLQEEKNRELEKQMQEMQKQIELLKLKQEHDMKISQMTSQIEAIKSDKDRSVREKELEYEIKLLQDKIGRSQVIYNQINPVVGGHYPGSNYAQNNHFDNIRSWLGGRCNFLLLYRATSHGGTAVTFHNHCNSQGPTITIVRSANGYLFGGFNPESWTSRNAYSSGGGSFIFILTNPHGNGMIQFPFVSGKNGPYDHPSYGPTWGGGHDLHISDSYNSNTNYSSFPHSYQDPLGYGNITFTGSRNFVVSDYEVFKVIYY